VTGIQILTRLRTLTGLALALVTVNSNGDAQATGFAEGLLAAGERVTGTWVLVEPPSNRSDEDVLRGALPTGFLSIGADGRYLMLLACNVHASDTLDSHGTRPVCRGHARATYAHTGHLLANASRIDFEVDHSTVGALHGNDLRTTYALNGNQLTLTFDAAATAASAGLQGTLIWQRLSGSAAPTATAGPSPSGCDRFRTPAQDLARSALNEARVDQ
jgi:hypothetical protein